MSTHGTEGAGDDGKAGANPLRAFLGRFNRPSPTLGTVEVAVDPAAVRAGLADRGDAGMRAKKLDRWVEEKLAGASCLSNLTAGLALSYLERIRHPLAALTLEGGVTITTRGYLAHMAVEEDPTAYGAGIEVTILGNLPDLRKGRPPQDLLNRVVKATRRGFEEIRAVPDDVWQGYLLCVTGHAHATGGPCAGTGDVVALLDVSVVEGLVRFGWVLRQVDLRYGQSPS